MKASAINFYLFLIITTNFIATKSLSQEKKLSQYLHHAAEHNPELKAYFTDYLAALEKVPQVGAMPDPELTMGFFIRPMERLMGNQQADIQLMQMFPWFGTLKTQKDEASKMALAQYEVFRDAKNSLFYQVKVTWYELYLLEQEIRITEENLDILKQYERLALIRFQNTNTGREAGSSNMPGQPAMNKNSSSTTPMDGGGSAMSDVLRAKIEIKALENTLALLKDSRLPLQAQFNQLLNRDYNHKITIQDTIAETPMTSEQMAWLDSIALNNPMLKMLDAEEEAYEAQKKMARLEGRPMLGAGVNYMPFRPRTENGMPMGGNDMVMPMVRLSIPIYRKKYNALHKEAELKQQAVHLRRQHTVNELKTRWSTAKRNLDDANRRATLYREQTNLARQKLNLLMNSYSTNGRDFEEVLRTQQQLLDYQLQLVTAIVDQHTAVAMLDMLAATELD